MTAAPLPRKKRRQAEPVAGQRSGGRPGRRGTAVPMHEALSNHPLVPQVRDPSPSPTSKQQRFLQVLARHLARDDPWIRNLVRVLTDLHIGVGPKPKSRYPRLMKLWASWRDQIDNRGDYSFSDWLREIYRNRIIDGDTFVRVRDRMNSPLGDGLVVPLQFQALQSEYVPSHFERTIGDHKFVCGIARKFDRVTYYAVYREHPGEDMTQWNPLILPANEIMHVCERRLGAPRGEVPLASALMRAIKAATLEDAELRRKMVSALMSVFITRPVDASDDESMLPTAEEVGDMIDAIQLSPAGVFELPYGYKVEQLAPKDEPTNFEKALRWNLMAICAAAGVPPHEVTGDWNSLPERMATSASPWERRAEIEQDSLEFQLLNPMWTWFVTTVLKAELFDVPDDLDERHLFEVEWEWPLLPLASFKQELTALMQAAEKGVISYAYITKTMFGLEPADVDRERAREQARKNALADDEIAGRLDEIAKEIEEAELSLLDE